MSKTRNIALALVLTVGVTLMTGCTTLIILKKPFLRKGGCGRYGQDRYIGAADRK